MWRNTITQVVLIFTFCGLSAQSFANTPPVAIPQSVSVTSGINTKITLQAQDADGNALTYGIQQAPQHGSVTAPIGNSVTYTSTQGYTGTDNFSFWVTDGTAFSTPATIGITVKPDDFLLTFVAGTLIPAIKQRQLQEFQEYIDNLRISDPFIQSCFSGAIPQGQALYDLTSFTCEGQDLSQADLSNLGQLVNLQTLELPHSKLDDISALSTLKNLTRLNLASNELTDISALAGMTKLTELDLSFNSITRISNLSNLTQLQELHLEANSITDISPLANKTVLHQLWLDDNNITTVNTLTNLTNLTHLGLGYNQISDISPISNLNALQILVLDANSIDSNTSTGTSGSGLEALSNLHGLQELYIGGNLLTDINALSNPGLTNLQTLELGFNQIDIATITSLSALGNLTQLGLENNAVSAVDKLSVLSNLQYLALAHNQIRNISPLSSLSSLNKQLDLRGNFLPDIAPVATMTNTFTLLADDNCLGDLVMPATISAFGKHWQFPLSRCDTSNTNDQPVAYAQNITLYKNTAKTFTLLGGDPEGDNLTYALTTIAAHGSAGNLGVLANSTLTYTPNTDYVGTDSFTFTVTDSAGLVSSPATVQITVRETPLITDPALQSCFPGELPSNSTLQSLTAFTCNGIDLSGVNLAQLDNLPNLTHVTLINANLSDISGLSNIGENWTFLDLRFNNIVLITALSNKANLMTIGLDGNQVNSLAVLSTLTNLQMIYADNNAISGASGLPQLSNLNNLYTLTLRNNRLLSADVETAWGNTAIQATPIVYVEQNCLIGLPTGLPANITIDMGGNPQRPPNPDGSCPAT
ncbi:MAG: leucine-rich repeat domain-containing protein [Candidatus Thiothrix sulfatifontis]|nr:MAG: leucine-rich repeat domain-containing protein [Candidatus Thiothrix sulfatifontis]